MRTRPAGRGTSSFDRVMAIGLTLPGVEAATRYDGAPVLRLGGAFMAGLASHPSAEPNTLVVRMNLEERAWLLEEAPDTYYVTEYYRPHPIVLARLTLIGTDALRDLFKHVMAPDPAQGAFAACPPPPLIGVYSQMD